jgi:hypothetical protein
MQTKTNHFIGLRTFGAGLALVIGIITGVLVLGGCGSREVLSEVLPTYSSINQVTISTKCVQCHESMGTYAGTMAIVKAGSPTQSNFYKTIQKGSMPLQSPKLSDREIQAVSDWITAGAPNN